MTRPMKFSLAATLLILAVGGATGWMNRHRLMVLDEDQRVLVAKAETLGLDVGLTGGDGERRISKRDREARSNEARAMTAELVAYAREMEAREKSGADSGEDEDGKGMDLMNRLMKLAPSQLTAVIAGLRDDRSLSKETRGNMLGFSILILGEDHPAAALALYTDSVDLLDADIGQQVVASALRQLAKDDPKGALDWLRRNEAAHPDLADDDAKRNIVAGTALTDPKLAFSMIGDLHLDDPSSAVSALVESGSTPGQRTAILSALREYLATYPDSGDRDEILSDSLESMGRNLTNENFETVKSWIKDADLSHEESGKFAAGLSYFNTKEDTGLWLDWIAGNLPESDARECADNLIGQWTQQDYLAAGQWLTSAVEGPTKNASIATYAETVAEYEPHVAVQWALLLPEGTERTTTLQSIYENWPGTDKNGAAEFARQYGVDTEVEP
jgi:hypothetical protein